MLVGIDLSTKEITIARLYHDNSFNIDICKADGKNWQLRYPVLYFQFSEILSKFVEPVQAAFIEDPPFVQNRQSFSKLTKVACICELAFMSFHITYFSVNNKVWKKELIGKGSASKEMIKNFAEMIWGDKIKSLSQDAIDALCLACYGYIQLNYQKSNELQVLY